MYLVSTLSNITYPGFIELPLGASIKPYLRLKLPMQPTNGKYPLVTLLEPEDNINNHQLHSVEEENLLFLDDLILKLDLLTLNNYRTKGLHLFSKILQLYHL